MSKTFVIAGSFIQANDWIQQNITYHANTHGAWRSFLGDYIIVSDSSKLRGTSDPHGIFIGTWYERPDIREILTTLLTQCRNDNKGVLKAIQYYGEYTNAKTTQ